MADDFDWKSLFAPNESPYFGMFRCGVMGIPLEDCLEECRSKGIPLREKDMSSYDEGKWKRDTSRQTSVLNPLLRPDRGLIIPILDSTLDDFDTWPTGWNESETRWFPCNEDNMPMQKWGYANDRVPTLYTRESAIALAPTGWVGQNLYAQPFIVFDIDGVGHGERDEQVIEFGNRFRDHTETWESDRKPGSFHLYFNTNRQIPISHFPYAKLDLMGNQKNAAVYTKDKVSNGVPRATLTDEIWNELLNYLNHRKEQRERLLQNSEMR